MVLVFHFEIFVGDQVAVWGCLLNAQPQKGLSSGGTGGFWRPRLPGTGNTEMTGLILC